MINVFIDFINILCLLNYILFNLFSNVGSILLGLKGNSSVNSCIK